MPIYEYRCSTCQHKLESLQRLSDAPLKTCPACGAEALVKLVSAAGFQLKGSGWYATDFKNSGSKPPVKAKTEASGGSDTGGDKGTAGDGAAGKSESSTAAKSESPSASSDGAGSKKESTSSASATPAASSSTARASE